MRPVILMWQTNGSAVPDANSPGALRVETRTSPEGIHQLPSAIKRDLETLQGLIAPTMTSIVLMTGPDSFVESGTFDFGNGNLIRFSTAGQGQLGPSALPSVTVGTVMWRVVSGEGLFEGVTGHITSNFFFDETGAVLDNHVACLILR